MSLANTLRDIAKESRLNKAEKTSLRLIATDVTKLLTVESCWRDFKKVVKMFGFRGKCPGGVNRWVQDKLAENEELRKRLDLRCPCSKKERDAKCAFVSKQTVEASKTGNVTLRNQGEIRTGTIPVWMAFRCLYCGEFFNQSMAEDHFGMTREEFYAK